MSSVSSEPPSPVNTSSMSQQEAADTPHSSETPARLRRGSTAPTLLLDEGHPGAGSGTGPTGSSPALVPWVVAESFRVQLWAMRVLSARAEGLIGIPVASGGQKILDLGKAPVHVASSLGDAALRLFSKLTSLPGLEMWQVVTVCLLAGISVLSVVALFSVQLMLAAMALLALVASLTVLAVLASIALLAIGPRAVSQLTSRDVKALAGLREVAASRLRAKD